MASIPSPPRNGLSLGPLDLRAYGVMIALGVVAAVWLSRRRWEARGGDPDQISRIALWAVPAGLIGARLYHVITDWKKFQSAGWLEVFAIWNGGLGIPGGMAAGILVGVWMARRQHMNQGEVIAAVVPGLPLAQAIGRLGNWFNQELFGSPTDLPWGLEIDAAHRPAQYLDVATFHPTFLYEAVWNLLLCGLLVIIDRRRVRRAVPALVTDPRRVSRPGSLLAVYTLGYGLGRLWIEAVRIDPASLLLGVRVNIWMSLVLIVASALYLLWVRGRGGPPRRTVLP
ncbi:MAG: prolipoprotein diacylglyceryl transferase [Acidimicrobiaceae bacterium]|nr:prolipoprotein diacylglyceryl transferase [Acidimicrobiaceae bacterium]MYK77045.1 prolipoprotein diacylglyceryl transferase [Acidimicrobiaceae bacterium]